MYGEKGLLWYNVDNATVCDKKTVNMVKREIIKKLLWFYPFVEKQRIANMHSFL